MGKGFLWFLLAGFALTAAVVAQPEGFQSGQWEIKIKMKVEEAPFSLPEETVKQCLTADDWAPKLSPPGAEQGDLKCKMLREKISGNRASFEMECRGKEGTTTMAGETVYSGETFEGTIQMEGHGGDMDGIRIFYQVQGRYLGPCSE